MISRKINLRKYIKSNENMEISILNKRDFLKYDYKIGFLIKNNSISRRFPTRLSFFDIYEDTFKTILPDMLFSRRGGRFVYYEDDVKVGNDSNVNNKLMLIGENSYPLDFDYIFSNDNQNLLSMKKKDVIVSEGVLYNSDIYTLQSGSVRDIKFVFDKKIKYISLNESKVNQIDVMNSLNYLFDRINRIYVNGILFFDGKKFTVNFLIIESNEIEFSFLLKRTVNLDFSFIDCYLSNIDESYEIINSDKVIEGDFNNLNQLKINYVTDFMQNPIDAVFKYFFKKSEFNCIHPLNVLNTSSAYLNNSIIYMNIFTKYALVKDSLSVNILKFLLSVLDRDNNERFSGIDTWNKFFINHLLSLNFFKGLKNSVSVMTNDVIPETYELSLGTTKEIVITKNGKLKIGKIEYKVYDETNKYRLLPIISKKDIMILKYRSQDIDYEIEEENLSGIFKDSEGNIIAKINRNINKIDFNISSVSDISVIFKSLGFILADYYIQSDYEFETILNNYQIQVTSINLFDILKDNNVNKALRGFRFRYNSEIKIKTGNTYRTFNIHNPSTEAYQENFVVFKYHVVNGDVDNYNNLGTTVVFLKYNILNSQISFYNQEGKEYRFICKLDKIIFVNISMQCPGKPNQQLMVHTKFLPTISSGNKIDNVEYLQLGNNVICSDDVNNTGIGVLTCSSKNFMVKKRISVSKNISNKILKKITVKITKNNGVGLFNIAFKHNFNSGFSYLYDSVGDVDYYYITVYNNLIKSNSFIDVFFIVPAYLLENADNTEEFMKNISMAVINGY